MATPDELERLSRQNALRVRQLGEAGVGVAGKTPVVIETLLEHILRHLGGDQAVTDAFYEVEKKLSEQLATAEKLVAEARRRHAAQVLGIH